MPTAHILYVVEGNKSYVGFSKQLVSFYSCIFIAANVESRNISNMLPFCS